ncbi:EamA family transporter [Natronomonas gomsonensis]|uniref:EamA family transporter n=1 Tax=Natronomonas gomsonensis TaxID=1046043 RepID=UPI0020CA4CF5|nr:EamA family transporter [Natronomonas gomsonensis]MCY4731577.1 EamA family transporter [Natronomonas gomsonensis]
MGGTPTAMTYALGAMVLWGAWGILANHALEHMSETAVLLATYAVAIGVVIALNPSVSDSLPTTIGLVFAIGAGITMSLGTLLYYQSVKVGKLSIVPAIPALYFVVTTLYGVTILDESLNLSQVAGIILAVIAIVLLTR